MKMMLNELDMITRLTCMYSHLPQRQVETNIISLYNQYKEAFAGKLYMTVVPSGTVKVSEYTEWMLKLGDKFDILFIDYDSNFARDEALSMYDYGGALYDYLTRLTRAGKLVFVASQPKINYFGDELLPLSAAGESSRKQHISDVIITLGRLWKSKMKMGKINVAKNRRGDNAVQNYIGTSDGLFYPCSDVLYSKFENLNTYQGLYTWKELQGMDVMTGVMADAEQAAASKPLELTKKE